MDFDLDYLAALAKAATRGPWISSEPGSEFVSQAESHMAICRVNEPVVSDFRRGITVSAGRAAAQRNKDFIAAVHPETVLALLERVRDLETVLAEFARVEQVFQDCEYCDDCAVCDKHEEIWDRVHADRTRLLKSGKGGALAEHLRQIRAAAERIESWTEETEELQDVIFSCMVGSHNG